MSNKCGTIKATIKKIDGKPIAELDVEDPTTNATIENFKNNEQCKSQN